MYRGIFKNKLGFTLIELLIVIGITALLAGLFLANYKEGEKSRNVRIAADSITSALRLMQNSAQAGLTPAGASGTLRSYMLEINTTATSRYQTMVEFKDASGRTITPPTVIEAINLPDKVYIADVIVDRQSVPVNNTVRVRFFPPFGKISMQSPPAAERANIRANFKLKQADSSYERTVTIDGVSGRIEAR